MNNNANVITTFQNRVGSKMKAKEMKILRKRLAKANRIDGNHLQGFNQVLSSETVQNGAEETRQKQLSVIFASSLVNQLQECLDLFERNMSQLYINSSWGLNMNDKKDELCHNKARFLLLLDNESKQLLGFVHFRFEYDDEESPSCAVLYVYEIQIEFSFRRCGLGKKLMEIIRKIAQNDAMSKILLTVFKSNEAAMSFYTKKMGFKVDETSPNHADYEILSCSVYVPEDN